MGYINQPFFLREQSWLLKISIHLNKNIEWNINFISRKQRIV